MELKYNVPVEVTEKQYNAVMKDCSDICAGLKKEGKFFIRLWIVSCRKEIQRILKANS